MGNKKLKYILGFTLICGAFIYLIWSSFTSSFQFALTPSEFLSSDYSSRTARISGVVAEGTLLVDGSDYNFKVTDGKNLLPVHYKGIVPNTFREGGEVVAVGSLDQSGKVFEAKEIIAKCASKYKKR